MIIGGGSKEGMWETLKLPFFGPLALSGNSPGSATDFFNKTTKINDMMHREVRPVSIWVWGFHWFKC